MGLIDKLRKSTALKTVSGLMTAGAFIGAFFMYSSEALADIKRRDVPKTQISEKKADDRLLKVGIASDSDDKILLEGLVSLANDSLEKYSISLEVGEIVEIALPKQLNTYDFVRGIKRSFSSPQDYYFVKTKFDLSTNGKDWGLKSVVSDRVSQIDSDICYKAIPGIIGQEILRLFSKKEDLKVRAEDISDYLKEIPEQEVRENMAVELRDKEFDVTTNYETPRKLEVFLGLDGISIHKALNLIQGVSREYEMMFNMTFQPIGCMDYELKLPENWKTADEAKKFLDLANNNGEIYVILTTKDLKHMNNGRLSGIDGKADSKYGCVWVTVGESNDYTVKVLNHEIGHIFKAEHLYLKEGVMHPVSRTMTRWTNWNREKILKNKFRTWLKSD